MRSLHSREEPAVGAESIVEGFMFSPAEENAVRSRIRLDSSRVQNQSGNYDDDQMDEIGKANELRTAANAYCDSVRSGDPDAEALDNTIRLPAGIRGDDEEDEEALGAQPGSVRRTSNRRGMHVRGSSGDPGGMVVSHCRR